MSEMENLVFTHPSRIIHRAVDAQLLDLAKKRAYDAAIFDEQESIPVFWAAEITNNRLDSYFTKMAESSLKNYAVDAAAGVSFLRSHDCWDLGMGYSLTGTFEPGEVARVLADFYTVPGLPETDSFIRKMRAGLARDVSIGFYGGEFICSLCNVDMFDWDAGCRHYPGDEVEIKDPQTGEVIRKETVFAWVANAHLAEVSAVYHGATPGAAILKARQLNDAGVLRPEAARILEQRYRHLNLKFPDARHVVAVGDIPTKENRTMADDLKQEAEVPTNRAATETIIRDPRDVEAFNNLRSMLTEAGFAPEQEIGEAVRALVNEIKTLRAGNLEIPKLRLQAADGEAYRNSLIDGVIAEGIRAMGAKDFDEQGERALLENADLEIIKRKAASYKSIGDKLFAGGRQSVDEVEEPQAPITRNDDAAYKIN